MTAYDNWRCHDHSSEQQAAYEHKHAALSAEIRSGLRLSDYIKEIECDASLDAKACQNITQAFLTGTDCGAVLHAYAEQWLSDHADKLALARLQGVEL
jgi:hypothetical protein